MQKAVRHTIFWVSIYLLWTYMKSGGGPLFTSYLLINLMNMLMYMTAYYLLVLAQIPLLFSQGKKLLFLWSMLVTSLALYIAWLNIGHYWVGILLGLGFCSDISLSGYLIQTAQFYSPAMVLMVWEMQLQRIREQERIHRLEKEKLSTELKYLKAQLNPHFLFNTLNNLYSFVIMGSPKAADMVLRLSGILDYILYKSQNAFVPLKEELDAIENFMELEKIRYGEQLEIEYQRTGDFSIAISPLLLLSLVENAFKHGASGDIGASRISIRIHADMTGINCSFWNTKSKYIGERNDDYKEGIGLSNIQRQLALTYPGQYELKIDEQEETFHILLVINPEHEQNQMFTSR